MAFINAIEKALKIDAIKELLPMQPGDVQDTHADVSKLISDIGYKPDTNLQAGINQLVEWYKTYY
jgi:UDP-glucuronate 4-epimerase